jgi:methyl-accepting chemotaxis protein-2 (aspartate sensor receptor)
MSTLRSKSARSRLNLVTAACVSMTAATALAGQESTIFRYDGQDFVREKTTLTTEDGRSAVDTKLDRRSPAYEQLVHKHSYSGEAVIFGQRCDSNYAPLTDGDGKLTGALFVATCDK